MTIQTTRFGEIEVSTDKILTFTQGLLGFENYKKFVLIEHREGSPFKWLQSIEDKALAFLVSDPFFFYPDYEIEIPDEEQHQLDIKNENEIGVLVTLSIPKNNPKGITANLLGPIIINTKTRVAKQIILSPEKYSAKYRIIENLQQYQQKVVNL